MDQRKLQYGYNSERYWEPVELVMSPVPLGLALTSANPEMENILQYICWQTFRSHFTNALPKYSRNRF